jgi:hypothetical protein
MKQMNHRGGKPMIQGDVVTNSDQHFSIKVGVRLTNPSRGFQFYSLHQRVGLGWTEIISGVRTKGEKWTYGQGFRGLSFRLNETMAPGESRLGFICDLLGAKE